MARLDAATTIVVLFATAFALSFGLSVVAALPVMPAWHESNTSSDGSGGASPIANGTDVDVSLFSGFPVEQPPFMVDEEKGVLPLQNLFDMLFGTADEPQSYGAIEHKTDIVLLALIRGKDYGKKKDTKDNWPFADVGKAGGASSPGLPKPLQHGDVVEQENQFAVHQGVAVVHQLP